MNNMTSILKYTSDIQIFYLITFVIPASGILFAPMGVAWNQNSLNHLKQVKKKKNGKSSSEKIMYEKMQSTIK